MGTNVYLKIGKEYSLDNGSCGRYARDVVEEHETFMEFIEPTINPEYIHRHYIPKRDAIIGEDGIVKSKRNIHIIKPGHRQSPIEVAVNLMMAQKLKSLIRES